MLKDLYFEPKFKDLKNLITNCKKVLKKSNNTQSIIEIRNIVQIGGKTKTIIAGPCVVESKTQIINIAKKIKRAGATILRGGAFKPRTSPYSFQGLGLKALRYLSEASKITGLPVVTELLEPDHLMFIVEYADIIQIGARNMMNYGLLKKAARTNKPILLKRGMSSSLYEFLCAAEYIMTEGNDKVILCERGIVSFCNHTRYTLDLSIVPIIKNISHLPIIVDPSHSTGLRQLIKPMSLASLAAGADGLMIEVAIEPDRALSDGPQTINITQFENLMSNIRLFG